MMERAGRIVGGFLAAAVVSIVLAVLGAARCEDSQEPESFPQTLILSGRIIKSDGVKPSKGDVIIAYNETQGDQEVGRGKVVNSSGVYHIQITLQKEFAGNLLYFELKRKGSGDVYELRESGEDDAPRAEVRFYGGFPFPETQEMDMYIGELVKGAEGGEVEQEGGSSSEPEAQVSSKYDINGDGRVDERDVAIVSRARVGALRGLSKEEVEAADINGDGAITLDDIIQIMRNADE